MGIGAISPRRTPRRADTILIVLMVGLALSACRFWEPNAPPRSFTPDDILLDGDALPAGWEALGPFPLTGHDLCTTECTSMGFAIPSPEGKSAMAMQEVFRYRSSGIAARTFEKVYVPLSASLDPDAQWTYKSVIAQEQSFGCGFTAGNVRVVCEWAGRYEEYIIVFQADREPSGLTLLDMEQVVRAIDARVGQYLSEAPASP